MRILGPNTGEDVVPVSKKSVFAAITDYGLKSILKEIVVAPAQHHWEWIVFSSNKPVDIKNIGDRFSSFDHSLNKAVNDVYSTVYEFNDFDEMVMEWKSMKYIDTIKTVYQAER